MDWQSNPVPTVPQMECQSKSPKIGKNQDFSVLKSSPSKLWILLIVHKVVFFYAYLNRSLKVYQNRPRCRRRGTLVFGPRCRAWCWRSFCRLTSSSQAWMVTPLMTSQEIASWPGGVALLMKRPCRSQARHRTSCRDWCSVRCDSPVGYGEDGRVTRQIVAHLCRFLARRGTWVDYRHH